MSTKNKRNQGETTMDYNQINTQDNRNQKAEQLLLDCWEVVGYTGQGSEPYPRTADETRRMEDLINQAHAAIEDHSDMELVGAIVETQDIVEWSKKRHWTFAWWIVICVAIMGFYYFWSTDGKEEDIQTTAALTDAEVQTRLDDRINTAKLNLEYYKTELANDTISDEKRATYEKYLANEEVHLDELNGYTVESFRQYLVERAEKSADNQWWSGAWCFIWIVLYILACRPRGYMITKRRVETAVASGAKKVLFGIAGILVGTAAAMQVTTYVTKWSDGTTTREDDSMLVTFTKFGFIAAAVLLVLWVARIVIVISTIIALLRNYDWKMLLTNPKQLLHDLK